MFSCNINYNGVRTSGFVDIEFPTWTNCIKRLMHPGIYLFEYININVMQNILHCVIKISNIMAVLPRIEYYNNEIVMLTLMVDSIFTHALWKFFFLEFSSNWSSKTSGSSLEANDDDKLTLTFLLVLPTGFLARCWLIDALCSTKNGW